MKTSYKKVFQILAILICIGGFGCKKFVEVDLPIDTISTESAFNTEQKITSALRGMYLNMVKGVNSSFGGAMSAGPGVSADEMLCNATTLAYYEFSNNNINASNTGLAYYWGAMYNTIYLANLAIINIPKNNTISEAAKRQYIAEARFVRAVNYFYLTNLFGDVPMAVSDDYRVNATLPRTPVKDIYQLVIDDLNYAQQNLSITYPGAITYAPRIRANRYSAKALLARVYLYQGDWANAETLATEVIEAKDAVGAALYAMESNLNNVFLLTSKEVILSLVQGSTLLYTYDGYAFVAASATTIPTYQFTDEFMNNFPAVAPLDLRKTNWMKANSVTTGGQTKLYYAPNKYKLRAGTGTVKTEALALLRLGETYLIRAEARAQQSKLALAIADMDVIRRRAGFTVATPAATPQPALLDLIAKERSLELFAELGHRWFDLKRRGVADEVLKNKPNWRPEAKLYPIPTDELRNNLAIYQNPGYSN